MTVLVPAGLPILDAARWVGASCWLELTVHQLLTVELARADLDDQARVVRWRVRAHRAEAAAAWHQRLPELREFPREGFVAPPADDGIDGFDGFDEFDGSGDQWWVAGDAGAASGGIDLVDVLDRLDRRYHGHEARAVGAADGPVRVTLSRARDLLATDRWALGSLPPR
jgi:hypothetical protein